jgi:hypothetical protein
MKANIMKLDKYTQHSIDGPYTAKPSFVDKVLFWLSGFVAGLIFTLLITGN